MPKVFTQYILFFFITITTFNPARAQKDSVFLHQFDVEGKTITGYRMSTSHEPGIIKKILYGYLKEIGDVESNRDLFKTENIQSLESDANIVLFSKTSSQDALTLVDFGLDSSEIGSENFEKLSPGLENLVLNFQLKLKIYALEENLKQAEQASSHKSNIYQKLLKENLNLEKELKDNREEKVRYQEKIEELDTTYKKLHTQKELNEELMDLTIEELEKIRLRIEQIKRRLQTI
jgi:hypothetical protein